MYDIILKKGKIIDGKGNPWFRGDIGIKDGFIKYIGRINSSFSKMVIDLEDKIVSPGFIDPHSHSDYSFFIDESAQSKVRQGVTTEVTGNCGLSVAPNVGDAAEVISHFKSNLNPDWATFQEYISALQKQRKVVNLAPLVGHGTLRAAVVGLEDRPATTDEIKEMKKILANSLEAGAFGLSLGLYFAPGAFATEKELLSLAEVLSSYNRVLTCHIRDEGSRSTGFVNAIKEVINIATKTSVSFNVSHIKAFGPDVWGQSKDVLELIDNARKKGVDITCDQYPYSYTGGGIAEDTLPPAFRSNKSSENIVSALQQTKVQEEIKEIISINIEKRGGKHNQIIADYPFDPSLEGKTLAEISEEFGSDPADTVIKMIIDGKCYGDWISKALNETDVENFMQSPSTMISSDGSSLSLDGPLSVGHPHPRNFGAFPRVIEKYVLEKQILTLEDAIRKMTSFPAQKFCLYNRGSLEVGKWADIVVIDLEKLESPGLENPKQYPQGIPYVLVNGELVIKKGDYTGELPGRVGRAN